ncbi:hypothetical protein Acsp02_28970 [Actinoplanes sp. NBRC 103695]|nr:hypothetical protein Acsp02_28970 [Actinoplanes sp. NBRC 103695]
MAGLIAAHGKTDGDGVLGIAPDAKILPVRDSHPGQVGSSNVVANGITWAAANGAKVINVSSANAPSIALADASKAAVADDVVVVAGAGNKPEYLQFGYPAATPGVLAVGSSDRNNKHAPFSFTGKAVQLCAPGVGIVSTRLNDGYSVSDGTSSSTAIVSGAAALVRAKFPDLSAQEVIERLTSTATDIGPPGRDEECGFGVLNIVKALTATGQGSESVSPAPDATPASEGGQAAPDAPPGVPVAALVGGGVVVLGGLVALLAVFLRRRRHR